IHRDVMAQTMPYFPKSEQSKILAQIGVTGGRTLRQFARETAQMMGRPIPNALEECPAAAKAPVNPMVCNRIWEPANSRLSCASFCKAECSHWMDRLVQALTAKSPLHISVHVGQT